MKKIITMILTVLMATVCCFGAVSCGQKKQTLYVYTSAGFPPYEYLDNKGNVLGVDVDIMNEIGKRLGYNVVVNDVKFSTIFTYITGNEFAVGAAGITKKQERDDIAVSSIVYSTSIQYVILPKTTQIQTTPEGKVNLSSLAGMKIGVQEGTTGASLVNDAITKSTGALYDTNAEKFDYNNAIIASGDIGSALNAVVIDKLPAQQISGASSTLTCYELTEDAESYVLYFNKNSQALVDKVNVVLQQLIDEGFVAQSIVNHSSK